MKKFILSIFAALAVTIVAEAGGRTLASFSAQQGGRFVLTINGERINGRPANTLNLDHLRSGRNMVHVEFHRNGRILRSRQTIFLTPGHETVFNIRGGRYGASISKIGEYPLRNRNSFHDLNNWTSSSEFKSFLHRLKRERFENQRFQLAQNYIRGRRIRVGELNRILNNFKFERTKIDFTVLAYGNLSNPQQLDSIFYHFNFRSSIREVNEKINRRYQIQPGGRRNNNNTW